MQAYPEEGGAASYHAGLPMAVDALAESEERCDAAFFLLEAWAQQVGAGAGLRMLCVLGGCAAACLLLVLRLRLRLTPRRGRGLADCVWKGGLGPGAAGQPARAGARRCKGLNAAPLALCACRSAPSAPPSSIWWWRPAARLGTSSE